MPKILKNFNLHVDGKGHAGRVEEVTTPKLTIKTEEIRAGGMDAPAEVDMGMEKIEMSFSLIEYDPDVLTKFGVVSGNSVAISLRGALVDDTTTTPMIIRVQGMFREIDMGNFKAGEKSVMQCAVACRYYAVEIGGKKLIEIDVDNMTRVIDGEDKLSEIRAALGI